MVERLGGWFICRIWDVVTSDRQKKSLNFALIQLLNLSKPLKSESPNLRFFVGKPTGKACFQWFKLIPLFFHSKSWGDQHEPCGGSKGFIYVVCFFWVWKSNWKCVENILVPKPRLWGFNVWKLEKSPFVENDESNCFIITRHFCWGMWSYDLCFCRHNEWSEFSTNQWKHWKHWDVLFSSLGSHMSRLIKRKSSWRHTTTSFIRKVWSCWWKIKKLCLEKLLTLHSKMESQLTSWCCVKRRTLNLFTFLNFVLSRSAIWMIFQEVCLAGRRPVLTI